jgi:hypothetical protein
LHITNIKVKECDINNFENYIKVFNKIKPDLIVLVNDKKYDAIDMFISASNSIEIVKNENIKNANFLVYSSKLDKNYLNELYNKFISYNLKYKEKYIGFPSQHSKESRITKDYVTANQFASMIRALWNQNKFRKNKTKLNNDCKKNEYLDICAELTFSIKDRPGAISFVLSKLYKRNMICDYANGKFVPSFIFYYSFRERRFPDTFIFTGTAKLGVFKEIRNLKEVLNYIFVNCEDVKEINKEKMFTRRIIIEYMKDCIGELSLNIGENDPYLFSNFPISTILRHKNKHYDVFKQRQRLLAIDNENNSQQEENVTFDLAHYKIWSEGEDSPGSLAEALSYTTLCTCNETNSDMSYVPFIEFSSNRPVMEKIDVSNNCKVNSLIAHDSIYIKLKPFNKNGKSDKIRAVKIKITKYLDAYNKNILQNKWIDYSIALKNLLNKNEINYRLYIVSKVYLQGKSIHDDSLLKIFPNEEIIEISLYKDITFYKIQQNNNESKPFFVYKKSNKLEKKDVFIDKINLSAEFIPLNVKDGRIHKLKKLCSLFRNNKEYLQLYEIVLINKNIIEESLKDNSEYLKKMYFIDDL